MTMTLKKVGKMSIIGLTEKIKIIGPKKENEVIARIDTGATIGSVDKKLAKEMELGPVVRKKVVKSSHGKSVRPVKKMRFRIDGRQFNASFTIADRKQMKYKVLIGQNVLKKNFLIDPTKKVKK
jgi:hypothetical protein